MKSSPGRFPFFLGLLALLLLPAVRLRAHAGDGDPLSRPVRLTLWGVSLGEAVREMERQTGVAIRFHLPDFAADPGLVHLVSGGTSLEAALEALAWRFSFRFRLAESGRVEISRSYGWVNRELSLRAFSLPPLTEDGDPASTRELLLELIKPLALLGGEPFLKVERHPLPGEPDRLRATAGLPHVLAGYLERCAAALSGEVNDPDAPGPVASFARARTRADDRLIPSLPVVMPDEPGLRAALGRLAEAAGMPVILGTPPPPGPPGPYMPAGERIPFQEAAEGIAAAWGLGRPLFLSGGLAFDPDGEGPGARDPRSRQLFWNGLAVAGMDARIAAERAGGGAGLQTLLRNEVFPEIWSDPVTAMVYCAVTGRLAVVAPANAVDAVRERLARIR